MAELEHKDWRGSTDGTPWMQRTLVSLFKIIPLRVLYGLMGIVIPFYMLFDRRGFRASYSFYRKRFGEGRLKALLSVYSNEWHFGQVVLDRFAMYGGKSFQIEVERMDLFTDLANEEGGFMMLSAHCGNFELAGYTLRTDRKRINALVFPGETSTVKEGREKMFSGAVRMIPVSDDMSHVFTMSSALSDGEIISINADRLFGSPRYISVPFLGEEAPFPMGPFALASSTRCPVLGVLVMKESTWKYRIHIGRLDEGIIEDLPARQRAVKLCTNYAHLLESVVSTYPHQWYNFFDFWKSGTDKGISGTKE